MGLPLEGHIKNKAELVELLIGAFISDVLVLIVGVQLEMFSHGKQAAGVESGRGPFFILALIEDLSADVRLRMIRADRKSTLQCDFVATAPRELVLGPIEIGAVAVGKEDPGKDWPARGDCQLQALDMAARRRDISEADGELKRARLGVVQIKGRYVFQAYKRFQKEIKAGPDFDLCRVAGFPSILGLEIEADVRMKFGVRHLPRGGTEKSGQSLVRRAGGRGTQPRRQA